MKDWNGNNYDPFTDISCEEIYDGAIKNDFFISDTEEFE